MNINGFEIIEEVDVEPDECYKSFFYAVGPDGKRHSLDISPYACGEEVAELAPVLIEAGFPLRYNLGLCCPIHVEDIPAIREYAAKRKA